MTKIWNDLEKIWYIIYSYLVSLKEYIQILIDKFHLIITLLILLFGIILLFLFVAYFIMEITIKRDTVKHKATYKFFNMLFYFLMTIVYNIITIIKYVIMVLLSCFIVYEGPSIYNVILSFLIFALIFFIPSWFCQFYNIFNENTLLDYLQIQDQGELNNWKENCSVSITDIKESRKRKVEICLWTVPTFILTNTLDSSKYHFQILLFMMFFVLNLLFDIFLISPRIEYYKSQIRKSELRLNQLKKTEIESK